MPLSSMNGWGRREPRVTPVRTRTLLIYDHTIYRSEESLEQLGQSRP
jgi:hypothetical protein